MSRRARGLALFGAAAVSAGLAASAVDGYRDDLRAQVGPLVPVLVARRDIPRGKLLTSGVLVTYVSERKVPLKFAPPRVLRRAAQLAGFRALATIAAGDYLSESSFGAPRAGADPVKDTATPGRLVEVPVAGTDRIAPALRPGSRVDVLITTERGGSPRTYLALQRIQLVDFGPAAGGGAADGGAGRDATATLRVTLEQAVLLTAAGNFAREIRLVPRPPGDDRRLAPTLVSASELAG